jgi:hypothetical protein
VKANLFLPDYQDFSHGLVVAKHPVRADPTLFFALCCGGFQLHKVRQLVYGDHLSVFFALIPPTEGGTYHNLKLKALSNDLGTKWL